MFPTFKGCFVEFGEMLPNLPVEPELRSLAAAELGREASALGYPRDARKYRLEALRAWETHLWRAFRASSSYYRDHFDLSARLKAGFQWFGSQANRLIWGNGEQGFRLLINFLALVLVVFPLLYRAVDGVSIGGRNLGLGNYLLLSIDVVTSYSGPSHVMLNSTGSRITASIERTIGIIAFGFFVTILFRRITRWR
jgi:hypothetical protein